MTHLHFTFENEKNHLYLVLEVRSRKTFLFQRDLWTIIHRENDQELKRWILYNKYKLFSHNLKEHLTFLYNNNSLGWGGWLQLQLVLPLQVKTNLVNSREFSIKNLISAFSLSSDARSQLYFPSQLSGNDECCYFCKLSLFCSGLKWVCTAQQVIMTNNVQPFCQRTVWLSAGFPHDNSRNGKVNFSNSDREKLELKIYLPGNNQYHKIMEKVAQSQQKSTNIYCFWFLIRYQMFDNIILLFSRYFCSTFLNKRNALRIKIDFIAKLY